MRYQVVTGATGPVIMAHRLGVLTFLEAKEQVVSWYVRQAEYWMAIDEEEFNAPVPF